MDNNLDALMDDYFEKLVVPEHQIIFEDTFRKIAKDFYGYGSSEKPNNLSWQDIRRIVEIADHLCPYTSKEMAEFLTEFQDEESYYREVLRRFSEAK